MSWYVCISYVWYEINVCYKNMLCCVDFSFSSWFILFYFISETNNYRTHPCSTDCSIQDGGSPSLLGFHNVFEGIMSWDPTSTHPQMFWTAVMQLENETYYHWKPT